MKAIICRVGAALAVPLLEHSYRPPGEVPSRTQVLKTSAPDVYITAITPDDTTILHLGDSTVIAKRSHVRLHVFCRQIGDVKFSGEAELTELPDLPDEPKPKAKVKAKAKNDPDA
jgi:hypothetical protein